MSNTVNRLLTILLCSSAGRFGIATAGLVAAWWIRPPTWRPDRPTIGAEPWLVEDTVLAVCSLVLGWVVLRSAASGTVWLAGAAKRARVTGHGLELLRRRPRPSLAGLLMTGVAGVTGVAGATGVAGVAGAGVGPLTAAVETRPLPHLVDGLQVPDRAYGGVRTHRVRAGESLWSITEALLRPGAGVRTTARTWPRLHRLNRDRVGADPHSIRPRTLLRLPAWAPTGGPRT